MTSGIEGRIDELATQRALRLIAGEPMGEADRALAVDAIARDPALAQAWRIVRAAQPELAALSAALVPTRVRPAATRHRAAWAMAAAVALAVVAVPTLRDDSMPAGPAVAGQSTHDDVISHVSFEEGIVANGSDDGIFVDEFGS